MSRKLTNEIIDSKLIAKGVKFISIRYYKKLINLFEDYFGDNQ